MEKITDRLWRKAGELNIPLTGAFELLPVCNLKCKMCYVRQDMDSVNAQGGLLSAEEWLDYAHQAKDAGMLYPLLTGGEPFLRSDFFEIYAKMQEMGLQISINSNGSLIDEKKAKWLGEHSPTRINITLYGASEESYEKLCGNGEAFEKVRKAVEYLRKYRVPFKFNTSITRENVGDLEQLIRYAKSMNAPIQVATYMFPPTRRDASSIGKNHRLSPDEAARARVTADWLQGDPEWFAGQAKRFQRFVPIETVMANNELERIEHGMMCRAGRSSFWLNWKGELGNCGMYSSKNVSLKDKTFEEAWKEIVTETKDFRYAPYCSICPNQRLCHACIAMVHNECGTGEGRPAYICEMSQASAKYYKEFLEKYIDQEVKWEPVEEDAFSCGVDKY